MCIEYVQTLHIILSTAGSASLGHNFLGSGPNWMQSVLLESLRSLVSNGKSFLGFGSPVGKIWDEQPSGQNWN